jgi:hypothetical protein
MLLLPKMEYNPLFLCPIVCKSPQELGILPMDAALELATYL